MKTEKTQERFSDLALSRMDALYTRAIRLTKNAMRAEKFVQQTYEKAFYLFDQYDWNNDFGEWLFQILDDVYMNQCLSQRRCSNYS